MVAPSISSQFTYAKLGQVITGLKKLGFHTVVEAALGADMVAYAESKELAEKGFLTSSCCPAFVRLYRKAASRSCLPIVSHNLSPMATIAKYIKEHEAHLPRWCSSAPAPQKRWRCRRRSVKPYVDCVHDL